MAIRDYQIILTTEKEKHFIIITPFQYYQSLQEYGNIINYLKSVDRDIKKYFESSKRKHFTIEINPLYGIALS